MSGRVTHPNARPDESRHALDLRHIACRCGGDCPYGIREGPAGRTGARDARQAPDPSCAPGVGRGHPTLLGTFGDWGAYTASPAGKKVCFALAKPANSQTTPPGRPRDPALLFVSARPPEKGK